MFGGVDKMIKALLLLNQHCAKILKILTGYNIQYSSNCQVWEAPQRQESTKRAGV